jgi:hypothetical protein
MMEEIQIDRYEPNHDGRCEVCEQGPTVTGMKNGVVVYASEMCGPCTFGTAKALDHEWWNDGEN